MDIKEITIEKIYEEFFEWWSEKKQDPNYINVLKDHVILTRHLTLPNSSLFSVLKSLRFINIGNEYYPANECYNHEDPILKFAYPDRLLPKSYQTQDWLDHLKLFGLNMEAKSSDLIRVAEILSENVWTISDKEKLEICVKLLNRINSFSGDTKFLAKIVSIKFLPSEFTTKSDASKNLLLKIYRPAIDELICIEESIQAIHKHLAWIEQPVLPEFCTLLQDGLCKNLDLKTLKNNFKKMVEQLEAPDYDILDNLEDDEMEELRKILSDYYKQFRSVIDEDNEFELDFVDLILIESPSRRFVQPDLVVKNLSRSDQIEDYFYQAPPAFEAHWSLFESLGSIQNVGVDECLYVLNSYYEELKDNKIMSDAYFKNTLIVFKILFADGILKKSSNENLVLYAPNRLFQMRPFHEL